MDKNANLDDLEKKSKQLGIPLIRLQIENNCVPESTNIEDAKFVYVNILKFSKDSEKKAEAFMAWLSFCTTIEQINEILRYVPEYDDKTRTIVLTKKLSLCKTYDEVTPILCYSLVIYNDQMIKASLAKMEEFPK